MSKIKIYTVSDGPPSLAVKMCFEALQLPYENIEVNYVAGEHLTEDYAKKNPQKEIPVLDDDGFYLGESNAILQYITDKYGKNDNLYPKDVHVRAIVNHRLCFNLSTYYKNILEHLIAPIFFDYQQTPLSEKKFNVALDVFNTYLERLGKKYVASDSVTIADLALVAATLCLEAVDYDFSKYKAIKQWYETFKRENPKLWAIAEKGMKELNGFYLNPPDLSHFKHPIHPVKKTAK